MRAKLTEPLLRGHNGDRDPEGQLSRSTSVRSGGYLSLGHGPKLEHVGADRGTGLYQLEREKLGLPSLVQGGRHAGRSRVIYRGQHLSLYLLCTDFFITMIQQKTWVVVVLASASYMLMFWLWGLGYWLVVRYMPGCIYGATTLVEAWIFAVITHTTIGYGNTGPQQCWVASWMISIQIIMAILQDAVVLGLVFARISHPKQRGRSIYISEVAVIARRDGLLKFMFRIADVRKTQVVQPSVRAYLYTWGGGRVTAEGEAIQVRCEQLAIGYIDGQLLLPLIIEHTIDETSPLCGHTHDSLMALNAEIVVIFEGTTEFGNPFMVRRSYLPTELAWGHRFREIIQRPFGEGDTRFSVNLELFHEVERSPELPPLPPSELSKLVVNRAKRTVPYPLLGENTLVLSDVLCLAYNKRGELCLSCRVADTYPNQMVELSVRMFLYRWLPPNQLAEADPEEPPFAQCQLECGYKSGNDRLYLRLPVEVTHVIDDSSPLAAWRQPGGLQADAGSEIVVVLSGYTLVSSLNRLRQRTYVVGHHLRAGFRFATIVKHPSQTRDHKPRVRWGHFHDVVPAPGPLPSAAVAPGGLPSGSPEASAEAFLQNKGLSPAPESHAGQRSQDYRAATAKRPSGLPSIPEAGAQPSMPVLGPAGAAGTQAAAAGAGSPGRRQLAAGPGLGSLWAGARLLPFEESSDFTVNAMDLQRYASTMGPGGDATLMHGMVHPQHRAPLPDASFFALSPRQPTARARAAAPPAAAMADGPGEAAPSRGQGVWQEGDFSSGGSRGSQGLLQQEEEEDREGGQGRGAPGQQAQQGQQVPRSQQAEREAARRALSRMMTVMPEEGLERYEPNFFQLSFREPSFQRAVAGMAGGEGGRRVGQWLDSVPSGVLSAVSPSEPEGLLAASSGAEVGQEGRQEARSPDRHRPPAHPQTHAPLPQQQQQQQQQPHPSPFVVPADGGEQQQGLRQAAAAGGSSGGSPTARPRSRVSFEAYRSPSKDSVGSVGSVGSGGGSWRRMGGGRGWPGSPGSGGWGGSGGGGGGRAEHGGVGAGAGPTDEGDSTIGTASTGRGDTARQSLPVSIRQSESSWQRGRSLANLFKLGEGSHDDLQLKESVREDAGLLEGSLLDQGSPQEEQGQEVLPSL